MKALASLPNIFYFFPLFLEKYTGLQNGDSRYTPLIPEFFMRCSAPGKTLTKATGGTAQPEQRWHCVTCVTQQMGKNALEELSLCSNFTGAKKIHFYIDLFYQFTLARVSRAASRQGKPWQYLKRAIKAHGKSSVKGDSCWTKPKGCITSLQRSPQTPTWVTMALKDPTTNAICQVPRTCSVTIYRIKQ